MRQCRFESTKVVATLADGSTPASRMQEASLDQRGEVVRFHGVNLFFACLIIGIAFVLQIDSHDKVVIPGIDLQLPDSCVYLRFVGIDCPGCGLTRSFISLTDGRWRQACNYNPAGCLVFLLVAIQIPYRGIQIHRAVRGKPELRCTKLSASIVCLLVTVLMAQWLLRLPPSL